MATIGQLNILLGGDAKIFNDALKSGEKNLVGFARSAMAAGNDIEKFNLGMLNTFAKLNDARGKFARGFIEDSNVIARGLVDQGKAASTTQEGIRNLSAQQIVLAKESREAAASMAVLAKAEADADKAARKLAQDSLKAAQAQTREFDNAIKSASYSLFLMEQGIGEIGNSLSIAFTAPLVGAGVLAVKQFAEWEKGTSSIQRAAEVTKQSAQNITQSFIEISKSTPIAVEELQRAGFAAGQAGVRGEEGIVNFANAAVMLSKVGGDAFRDLPLDDLTDNLAKTAIAFGEAGDNMENVTKIASTLLAVGKSIPGGLGEVIEAMRRTSGVAADFGISLSEATAFTGTLIAAAIPAERAGTELSRVFIELARGVDEVAEFLGYTGESLEGFRQRMEDDMGGVLVEFINRLGLVESSLERDAIAAEIFGEVGAKAFRPLVNNPEVLAGLLEIANYEMERGTLLASDFAIQSDNLAGTFKVFQNNVQALAHDLGSDLAPIVSYLAQLFTQGLATALGAWKSLDPTVKAVIFSLGALLAVAGPVLLIMKTLFVAPIVGAVTFASSLYRLVASLGTLLPLLFINNAQLQLMQGSAIASSLGMHGLAASMLTASTASTTLASRLALLLLPFIKILAIVALVTVAIAGLAKLLGVGLKLPKFKTPNIPALPEVDIGTPKPLRGEGGEGQDVQSEADRKAEEKALKEREDALEKEIKARQRARDKEIRALDENIRAFEKARNAELKILEDAVEGQRDALDTRKELWEEEREIAEEQIDVQKETLEAAKEAVKAAKKTLDGIKKAQKGEVDAAEGQADLAKANLEASQAALKREQILGRDEFDESFRIAEERTKAAENALQLARENVVRVKREYEQQIAAQEAVVEAVEEQVSVQQDSLDALEKALDQRKNIVDKEIDLLDDELNIRQKALADFREVSDERLAILKEERDTIKLGHDEEIEAMRERLDALREQSQAIQDQAHAEIPDFAESLAETNEEIQKQLEKIRSVNLDAFKAQDFGIDFGGLDIETGGLLDRMKKAFEGAREAARQAGAGAIKSFFEGILASVDELGRTIVTAIVDPIFGRGTTQQLEQNARGSGRSIAQYLLDGLNERLTQLGNQALQGIFRLFGMDQESAATLAERARTVGLTLPNMIWGGFSVALSTAFGGLPSLLLTAIFGEQIWQQLNLEAQEKGVTLPNLMWAKFVETTNLVWQGLLTLLLEAIFGKATWDILTKEADKQGKSTGEFIWGGFTGFVGSLPEKIRTLFNEKFITPIRNMFGSFFSTGEEGGKNVVQGMQSGGAESGSIGAWIIDNFIRGLSNWGGIFSVFSNIRQAIYNNLGTMGQNAWDWGRNLVNSFKNGMESGRQAVSNAVSWISDSIRRLWQGSSPPREGVLQNIDKWGANLTKTFAENMALASPEVVAAVGEINNAIKDSIGNVALEDLTVAPTVAGGIGANIAAQADQANVVGDARATAVTDQAALAGQTVVNKNYNIQPGQMIASRGEIRNFIRMLQEYEAVEEQR